MLCNTIIVDYKAVPVTQLKKYLTQGYQLYGPLITRAHHETPLLQAVVKTAQPSPNYTKITHALRLNALEIECMRLLIEQKKLKEMANILHRPVRTIENTLKNLREKLQCKNNIGIVLAAYQFGLIVNGKLAI